MNKKSLPLITSVGLLFIVLLAGCCPTELLATEVEAERSSSDPSMDMAERIEFHDALWEKQLGETADEHLAKRGVIRAERYFQEQ